MVTTKEDVLDFIKKNPLFFIATIDNDQPHVRAIMMHKVDENGIIFTTGKNKDFYRQLLQNPKVELCFYSDESQVRIIGTALETDEDLPLKQEIVSSRPFMLTWIESIGYEVMGLFRVVDCKATCWSLEMPLARKRYVTLFEQI